MHKVAAVQIKSAGHDLCAAAAAAAGEPWHACIQSSHVKVEVHQHEPR